MVGLLCYTFTMPDEGNEKLSTNMLAPEGVGKIEAPEMGHEAESRGVETARGDVSEHHSAVQAPVPIVPVVMEAPVAPAKDEVMQRVEEILSAGLGDIYSALPEAKKPLFRAKGEEVAAAIRSMIAQGKVKVHDVLRAIRDWLRMIPGVNKFFLEQEAKIKTDSILAYGELQARGSHNAV